MVASKGQAEAVLRDEESAVAAALCPGSVVRIPISGAILLPRILTLPAATLSEPAFLLLPTACLIGRPLLVRLLTARIMLALLRWLRLLGA